MSKALDSLKRKALAAVLSVAKQWCFKKIDEFFGTTSTEPSEEKEQAGDKKAIYLSDTERQDIATSLRLLRDVVKTNGFCKFVVNDEGLNEQHTAYMIVRHKKLK